MHSVLNSIIDISKHAGKIICDRSEFTVRDKGSAANYVSSVDIKVEEYLKRELADVMPEAAFIGEESGGSNISAEYVFIIDPIDGTANFVHNIGISAVSVALMKDKKPYIGVVHYPYLERTFWAQAGEGAYLNGERVRVSDRRLEKSILSIAMSVYDKRYSTPCFALAEAMMQDCEDIRRLGSAAIELSNLGAGFEDMFFEARLFPWDYAAAALIIREAGGYIGPIYSDELPYFEACSIVAANSEQSYKLLQNRALKIFKDFKVN